MFDTTSEEDLQDLKDLVEFLRRCRLHKPGIIKMIGGMCFDPRKHCSICVMDWRSLQRTRVEGKDSYDG